MVELRCNVTQEMREGVWVIIFSLFDLILGLCSEKDYVSSIALFLI
jgi:hypothetical protein